LGSVLTRGAIKSIKSIIQACRKFSAGDFSHRVYHDSNDEIGELAEILDKMAQDIEDKISEIKTHNQKLSAIFNSMIEGVIVVDSSNRIVSINPTIENIFSVSGQGVQGRFFLEAIPNNDIYEIINSVLKKAENISKEISLVWPVSRIFQVNASPIFEKDKVGGCLLVIHDITEIRKLESMRKDFVANVSHELKTPLTSIKGFIETLLEGALEDKENSRNFLRIIQEHSERLNSLIDDLLELSHIESGQMKLEIKEINLKEMADKVLSGFKSKLHKKKVMAENSLPSGLLVRADIDKIEQVLINLVDNAVKFNKEKGSIKIYSQDSGDTIKVVVEDSGIGIPHKDIPRIFERFYRVDKARSRELGGTGLGLSIVKHIVELHAGSVGVESTEGLGSKFFFTLPK
jgi:two-component system phosphate regulon sensor histidine kinase PhoR